MDIISTLIFRKVCLIGTVSPQNRWNSSILLYHRIVQSQNTLNHRPFTPIVDLQCGEDIISVASVVMICLCIMIILYFINRNQWYQVGIFSTSWVKFNSIYLSKYIYIYLTKRELPTIKYQTSYHSYHHIKCWTFGLNFKNVGPVFRRPCSNHRVILYGSNTKMALLVVLCTCVLINGRLLSQL